MKILLKNGHIIEPNSGMDAVADILIVDGVIEKIASKIHSDESFEEYKLEGKLVAPGFFDMHVHLREPGYEHKETIETGLMAAATGGFTGVCCMPNTNPPIDEASVVKIIKEKAAKIMGGLVNVYPIAAATKHREGKELSPMAELVDAGAVAFSDDGSPIEDSEVMRRAMEYADMLGKLIIQHPEDRSLAKGGVMNEGLVSTSLGLPPIPAIAEEIMIERDIRLAEYIKARFHAAHISTAGSVDIIRKAKLKNNPVTCEVTPHHFSLTEDAVRSFDTNTKMHPPLRTQDDIEAIKEGLKDGTIDVIATDHAPHSFDEKEVEFLAAPFGIVGLETAVGLAVTGLIIPKILSIEKLIEKMSINPRRILDLPIIKIVEGQNANLTIIDISKKWQVRIQDFKSKSKNSPFNGRVLTGKAFAVVNNAIIYVC
jgi:dihydroorotase